MFQSAVVQCFRHPKRAATALRETEAMLAHPPYHPAEDSTAPLLCFPQFAVFAPTSCFFALPTATKILDWECKQNMT